MANSTVPNPSQQVCWQSAGSRRQIPPGTIVLFPREDDGTGRDDRPHDYHGLLSLGPWDPPSDRPCVLQYRVLSCWILGWSQNIKLNGHIPPTRTRVVELLEFHYYRYLNYVIASCFALSDWSGLPVGSTNLPRHCNPEIAIDLFWVCFLPQPKRRCVIQS